jgi:hypothetical protein
MQTQFSLLIVIANVYAQDVRAYLQEPISGKKYLRLFLDRARRRAERWRRTMASDRKASAI